MVIDDLHGYVLDYGRSKYKAPRPLAEHVQARDYTCRTPGCPRPAVWCDADHLVSWPAGETSEQNLCSECRHDHRLKHEGRRAHHLSTDPAHPPGTVLITTAAGHLYLSMPHDYRPLRPSILPDLGPEDPARSSTTQARRQAAGQAGGQAGGGASEQAGGQAAAAAGGQAASGEAGGQAAAAAAAGGQAGGGAGGQAAAAAGGEAGRGTGGMRFAARDWL